MTMELTLSELAGVVFVAVVLAATDATALSRLFVCVLAKKLGVEPAEIMNYTDATSGNSPDEGSG
ncbi:MAG: hypothetical protein ACI91T_000135 [Natronomonas sp.]|jgi:hypothetical protein